MALVFDEPFFGHLMASVNREVSTRTPTAAVTIRDHRPLMIVNPEFFTKVLTRKPQRVAVVKHEALHLVLKHLLRPGGEFTDPWIHNLAADLVVNQFIGSKWQLPEGAILLDSFPGIPLEPDQSVEWYYERLLAHRRKVTAALSSSHSDHGLWSDGGSATGELIDRELARLVRQARDRAGRDYRRVPEPVRATVDAMIAELEPTIDWRRTLRMFSNSSRRTRMASTLRRPSKRYGTYPGLRIRRDHRLAVAIDTSASVSDDVLSEFFAEIRGMWRQGSEITIIEADEIVQDVWPYAGDAAPASVSGRGGTAFDPVFRWVNAEGVRFDALIYLTDGRAAAPAVRPKCPLLWVLPPAGDEEKLRFGRIARIAQGTGR